MQKVKKLKFFLSTVLILLFTIPTTITLFNCAKKNNFGIDEINNVNYSNIYESKENRIYLYINIEFKYNIKSIPKYDEKDVQIDLRPSDNNWLMITMFKYGVDDLIINKEFINTVFNDNTLFSFQIEAKIINKNNLEYFNFKKYV